MGTSCSNQRRSRRPGCTRSCPGCSGRLTDSNSRPVAIVELADAGRFTAIPHPKRRRTLRRATDHLRVLLEFSNRRKPLYLQSRSSFGRRLRPPGPRRPLRKAPSGAWCFGSPSGCAVAMCIAFTALPIMLGGGAPLGPVGIWGDFHQRSDQAEQRLMFGSVRFVAEERHQINMGKASPRRRVRLMNDEGSAISRVAREKPGIPIRTPV